MWFKVRRASERLRFERIPKPCDEAVVIKEEPYEDTTIKTYGVEINTIEDLLAFVKKYGEIIFDGEWICIYDDYVE